MLGALPKQLDFHLYSFGGEAVYICVCSVYKIIDKSNGYVILESCLRPYDITVTGIANGH